MKKMTMKTNQNPFIGQWRITEMPMFSIEMFEPPMLLIQDESKGFLKFCGIEADVDYEASERDGKPFIEFTWLEPGRRPQCGRGWALISGDSMSGKIYFHASEHSEFAAVRVVVAPEENIITAMLRRGPITLDPDLDPESKTAAVRRPAMQPAREKSVGKTANRKVLKPQSPIPKPARSALKDRLERHIAEKWNHTLVTLILRFHGAFAYIDVQDPTEKFPLHLCRLDYLGDSDRWGFAFYKYSDEVYEKSGDWNGSFITTPEMAFDVAATVYLSGG
jgi:hypothetical protein